MAAIHLDNEPELVARLSRGDLAAFRIIHDHYWNGIFKTSLSYLKSTEWAQDIVQDVFLKVWEKRASFAEVHQFPAYLHKMVRNELISALRKKWEEKPLPHYEDSIPADCFHPEHHMDARKIQSLIHKAREQLSPQQQLIFTLTRDQGMSHEEIAKQLGIDKRTVSNHITIALNKLRLALKEYPDLFLLLLCLGTRVYEC